jgi:hypothetical protein
MGCNTWSIIHLLLQGDLENLRRMEFCAEMQEPQERSPYIVVSLIEGTTRNRTRKD